MTPIGGNCRDTFPEMGPASWEEMPSCIASHQRWRLGPCACLGHLRLFIPFPIVTLPFRRGFSLLPRPLLLPSMTLYPTPFPTP